MLSPLLFHDAMLFDAPCLMRYAMRVKTQDYTVRRLCAAEERDDEPMTRASRASMLCARSRVYSARA